MDDAQKIADALTSLVKLMVDRPDEVRVEFTSNPSGIICRVSVALGDTGKLIGKQGRTARALRIILAAIGMTVKRKISLDIVNHPSQEPTDVS